MSTLKLGTGSTITITGLTQKVIDIDGPNMSVDEFPADTLASTGSKEFIPGTLVDNGMLRLKTEWDGMKPTIGVTQAFTFTPKSANAITGNGFIKEFNGSLGTEKPMTAEFTIRITGALSQTSSS